MPSAPKKKVRGKKQVRGKKPVRQTASPTVKATGLFPIVAIGASAGGLEAFSNLLRALPAGPGIALVFIPHLDPTHESAMAELLSRTTRLPVVQAFDGTRVTINSVYVLPPNSDMTISQGVLQLRLREAGRGHHMPVDIFFRSLAKDQGANAAGVILSGTANDGTLGLAAIKDHGGLTFAQDSDSAKYDGMPSSAVASGVVDYVLPPDRIAQELVRLPKQPSQQELPNDTFDGRDREMKDIFRLLKTYSKVDFADYKMATIRRRILRRMNINHMMELRDYVKLLQRNRQELQALYRDVLINVTSFFRNPQVFENLREVVYPRLFERPTAEPIRVWVPGCSTGEEAYSHAISLVERLSELRVEVPVQIFGTDLSENAIQKARIGIYKDMIVNEVSEVRRRRFFQKVPSGYQISKTIRDMCVFARQNVFGDPPFSRMDLISCRNVLIYLSPVLQKKVVPIFHYALRPNGFLLVGNSEGLVGSGAEIFDLVDRRSKIYKKKPVPSPVTFGLTLTSHEGVEARPEQPYPASQEDEPARTPVDVQREADRLLLTRYVPSAVVVNDSLDIVQSRGSTNRYLELPPGRATLNLLKMARPGLLYELRSLVDQARKNLIPVSKDGIAIGDGNEKSFMRLEVIPFHTPASDQRHFLVLFEERENRNPPKLKPAPRKSASELEDGKDVQLGQLQQELASTKEYLQAIIESQEATNEELQSANEEIQSGNEELQSTNEELQTSKEELESANEELNTVNEEIQHRNQQLAQFSNDLVNILNSATIPMVMLGEDLHIRRFTPEAERVFGFSSHDIGKELTHLPLDIDVPNLERWMLDVMRDVRIKTAEVRGREGETYTLRITPYRTPENKIDGVVLILLDISELIPPPQER